MPGIAQYSGAPIPARAPGCGSSPSARPVCSHRGFLCHLPGPEPEDTEVMADTLSCKDLSSTEQRSLGGSRLSGCMRRVNTGPCWRRRWEAASPRGAGASTQVLSAHAAQRPGRSRRRVHYTRGNEAGSYWRQNSLCWNVSPKDLTDTERCPQQQVSVEHSSTYSISWVLKRPQQIRNN